MRKFLPHLLIGSLIIGLVFAPHAQAASVTASFDGGYSFYMSLIDCYYPELDESGNPVGNYVIATYEGFYTCRATFGGADGYTSGYINNRLLFNANVPSGATASSLSASTNYNSIDNIYGTHRSASDSVNSYSIYTTIYLDNVWTINTANLYSGNIIFTCYFPYTGSNVPDPNVNIICNVSNVSFSYGLSKYATPQDFGLCGIISSSINNGDFNNDLASMISLLTLIKDNNSTYYTNILAALNTENDWLEEIFHLLDTQDSIWLPSISNNTSLTAGRLSTLISDLATYNANFYTSYGNKVLLLLGKLADMSASEATEAQEMSQAYAVIASKGAEQAVAMNPAMPSFNSNQFDMNSSVDATQRSNFVGVLGILMSNSLFVRMMLILMTCAIAGFALYGRKST